MSSCTTLQNLEAEEVTGEDLMFPDAPCGTASDGL